MDFKVPLPQSIITTASADIENNGSIEAKKAENVPPHQTQMCPYKEPPWSSPPPADIEYKFEVLKSGKIIEQIENLNMKPVWKFGRLPENDIEMAHPTISRFHAVLQYRPPPSDTEIATTQPAGGWYIYDLGSTHGTFLNKQRIPPRVYIRIRVGWMLRLGSSTRSYILQGPSEDEEPESELSVTELRTQRLEQQNAEISKEANKAVERERREREDGINWGMGEDADEETDLTHNPYASTNNEELYLDDPKRTLRGYFEREDTPLEYKCDEMSVGSFVCRVELPIYDTLGRPVIAEVVHKGRKKECVVQCALEACRILDRYGVLRQANQEPQKRKKKAQDSDSDDDSFWDRTGDIERKKQRKANAQTSVTLTYENLLKQKVELAQQLSEIESNIVKCQEIQKRVKATRIAQEADEGDDLDNFMENLNEDVPQLDKIEIRKLRLEQQRIKAEQQKLNRLIQISKPLDLPSIKEDTEKKVGDGQQKETIRKQLPIIGKRNQFSKFKIVKTCVKTSTNATSKNLASDEEEFDDDIADSVEDRHTFKENTSKSTTVVNDTKPPKNVTVEVPKQYGPAFIPKDISIEKSEEVLEVGEPLTGVEITNVKKSLTSTEVDDLEEPLTATETGDLEERMNGTEIVSDQTEQLARKRRQRQRQRYKRQDVDVEELEEHENSEKYAKWIPPDNQSGDGYTKLNDKYGY